MGQDDKKTVNVSSYNQTGGITAYHVNIAPLRRHLTPEIANQLESKLPNDDNIKITVVSVYGDQEALNFATEIKHHLLPIRKNVSGVDQVVYSKPQFGQLISKKSDQEIEIIIGSLG